MKLPWVSRARLEDAEARFAVVDAERRELLDRLLGDPRDHVRVSQARAVERVEEEPVEQSDVQGTPVSFSTPFDRVLTRFDDARRGGKVSPQFRARMN